MGQGDPEWWGCRAVRPQAMAGHARALPGPSLLAQLRHWAQPHPRLLPTGPGVRAPSPNAEELPNQFNGPGVAFVKK